MQSADDASQGLSRRRFLGRFAALGVLPLAGPALAQSLDATALNIAVGSLDDQSGPLQEALLRAAAEGRPLFLPAGTYYAQNLQVPSNVAISGVAGATSLAAAGEAPVARIAGSAHVSLDGIGFTRGNGGPSAADRGLLEIEASDHVAVANCTFTGGSANGIAVRDAAAAISGCDFIGHGLAAIFSIDSRGLTVTGNRIENCGNGGILIWGSMNRHDGSIVTNNAITKIAASNGGNGQNGNGISVFRCNDVIVADNQVTGCTFAAIRLNSTNNVTVTGNICRKSGDVAIVSELAFSGSMIAGNIIDDAAAGIAIANLEAGGRLATCSGNIVRSIRESSEGNPDRQPFGIYVEAETTVTGNTIDDVPGIGIIAGNGTFLRGVAITGNVLYAIHTGIAVSVVEDPAPGPVLIADNVITDPLDHAIIGRAGEDIVSTDLVRDAARFPHITLADNRVTTLS